MLLSPSILVLTFILTANALPWPEMEPTATYDAADWSPRTTDAPAKLLKRDYPLDLCGWVGGNSLLPAECGTGQKCVFDTGKGMVGCCPLSGSCTAGVFTACLGSGDQKSTRDPNILTWYVFPSTLGSMLIS
jgi:hypothetical protein